MDLLMNVAAHALDSPVLVDQATEVFEVRGTGAAVARSTRRLRVLELELESGPRAVVERGRRELRAARRVTRSAPRRIAELGEPSLVMVVLRVADLARRVRLRDAERLGVAVVALDVAMRGTQVELGLLGVIEVLRLERLERRRVAPLAIARAEQVTVVRADVAAGVAAAVGLRERQLEHALDVALAARDIFVAAEQRHRCVLAIVVVEL